MQGIAISRPPTAGLCLAPDLRHTRPTLVFLASVLLTTAVPALSAAAQVADLRNRSVVRFAFDNKAGLRRWQGAPVLCRRRSPADRGIPGQVPPSRLVGESALQRISLWGCFFTYAPLYVHQGRDTRDPRSQSR